MIHVITVHHLTGKWLRPQIDRIRRYVPRPHTLHVSVNFLLDDDGREVLAGAFVHPSNPRKERKNSHRPKLMQVTNQVLRHAADDDVLLFLDGDAFPVAPIDGLLEDLRTARFVGVKRTEKGEQLPHPCFALATVGFWREFRGTWRNGKNRSELFWRRVARARVPVSFLKRTDGTSLHSVFFGVYGDVVYHHGAGFRRPVLLCDPRDRSSPEVEREVENARVVTGKVLENLANDRYPLEGLQS